MALLGVLAARHDGRELAAGAFLDEAVANLKPALWPAPLFRYLKGQIPEKDLLAVANDPQKETDARTVIGLEHLHRGHRKAAMEYLIWVRDDGFDRSICKDLARET